MVQKTYFAQGSKALGTHFSLEFEEIISPAK
jgi:hypothetical protein